MKKLGDYILVNTHNDVFEGCIVSIMYNSILVSMDGIIISFDTINGESEDGYSIDLSGMDIPENLFKYVKNKMQNEGFHYCFTGYSDWKEIKDKEFHKLKAEYLESAKRLEEYIEKQAKFGSF